MKKGQKHIGDNLPGFCPSVYTALAVRSLSDQSLKRITLNGTLDSFLFPTLKWKPLLRS